MKNYMKKLFLYAGICFVVGIIGRLLPYGKAEFNFIFEDMIWFPIEVVATILVFDKVIQIRDESRDKIRYVKATKRANSYLIKYMVSEFADLIDFISHDDPSHDKNKIYKEVLNNPEKRLTQEFFESMRTYHYVSGNDLTINYDGFSNYHCQRMYDYLQKYLDRYMLILDDDVFDIILELQDKIYLVGKLNLHLPTEFITVQHQVHGIEVPAKDIHDAFLLNEQLTSKIKEITETA